MAAIRASALYAVLNLTVVRMLPVAVAFVGARLSKIFMGWFGPRGLASIVLGLVYLEQEIHLPGEPTIRLAVMMTVLISIFAHGLSAMPDLYARKITSLYAAAPEHLPGSTRRIGGGIDMLRQFLVGAAVSVCNIVIHALVMAAVVRVARTAGAKDISRQSLRLIAVMVATVSVLMAAHTSEVIVWSLAYAIVDASPAGADPVYFAFVNYTTLGYGDVTPVERWRLLGPMTAMNGVLLFGWSTAVIFEVLRRTVRFGARPGSQVQP